MTLQIAPAPPVAPMVQQVVEQLAGYNPERIILFGSRARGDAREHSDIDLLVIKETALPRPQRAIECRKHLTRGPGVDVEILVNTPAEIQKSIESRNPFIAAIFTDGIVVYDRHSPYGAPMLRSQIKEPTMESRLTHGQSWTENAEMELASARSLLEFGNASSSCFHSQQAAEKALKGFLIYQGRPLERTHSVVELAAMCVQEDEEFANCTEAARALNAMYIDTRYPDVETHEFKGYETAEAERALSNAQMVVDLVGSKMPPAAP